MTSFTVFSRSDGVSFDVTRLDINQWILPGIFGRQVILCDVGLRLSLTGAVTDQRPLKFDLGLPFTVRDEQGLHDLVPVMLEKPELCSLIFGDIKAVPNSFGSGVSTVDDGGGDMRLERCDSASSKPDSSVQADGRPFSLWTVAAKAVDIPSGVSVYMRFRFRLQKAGSTWAWQRGERRRSHAISDLRVNELRDKPQFNGTGPDFSRALPIERVNGFVITQARLKAGRVSPEPKYVRILEGGLWDSYVKRRLSRSEEPFIATYWTATKVDRDKPFRAFLEVERRRPTSARWSMVTIVLLVAAFTLLEPLESVKTSIAANALSALWAICTTIFSATLLIAAVRLVVRSVSGGKWRIVAKFFDKWEAVRFRRKG